MKFKFNQNNGPKVYFTSDWHLNHSPKWDVPLHETRGYTSVTDMNDDIINKINSVVRYDDILFNLGDFSLNCSENDLNSFISRINCQNVHLLWGNHNSPISKIYQREVSKFLTDRNITETLSIYPFRYKNIVFCGDYLEINVDGKIVVMMHYPLDIWNYMKDGSYMLCGHSHYNFPRTQRNSLDGLILDVGWEGKLAPYSFDEIDLIMRSKKIRISEDHHKN